MKGNRSPKGYRLFVLLVAAFIASALSSVPSAAQSNSQVRIVRLSFVEGTVTMYRPDVDEWAKVFVNTPIQQGFKLATDANSFAEVEFENGSTARLGQSSELDFTGLSLSPAGSKINRMALAQGYATFAVVPETGDVYEVHAAGSTFTASAKTMFRVDLEQGGQRLEVFKGNIDVQSPYGSGAVAKNQVLELTPGSANPFQIANGITEDAWDQWVDKRQQVETLASNRVGPNDANWSAGSSLYGWNDLSYYGNWSYLPGFGYGWIPMMGAGWSPYSIGRWDWYPGMGYTWISGLPWGWLPFHYGNWAYMTGYGWCWLPGNFSSWSPGMVTWYEGQGWIGWAPRTYGGSFNTQAGCPSGQNCSTAVSLNTFQSGRPISPNDVVRVSPLQGHLVTSPTVPLTRSLRLPGPAVSGSPLISTTGAAGGSGARVHPIIAAPTRIFAGSTIRGAWNVQPHAPAVFDQQTRRFVNRSGPAFQSLQGNTVNPERRLHGAVTTSTSAGATVDHSTAIVRIPSDRSVKSFGGSPVINNDVLLPSRTGLRSPASHPGNSPASLTSIPISTLETREGAIQHSSSLMPSAQPAGNEVQTRSFQEPRMPNFQRNNSPERNRSMGNSHNTPSRSRAETNRRSGMSQSGGQRAPASRASSGGFGGGGRMSQSHESMGGGMSSGGSGGMGGGARSGGASSQGPHR